MAFQLYDQKLKTTRSVNGVPYTAMPWALNSVGQIVFIDCADDKTAAKQPVPIGMTPCTAAVSKTRRLHCQSALGDLVLHHPGFTSPAVTKVSLGVLNYITSSLRANKPIVAEIAACTGKYMYSKAGFGRLGQPEDKPALDSALYTTFVKTLTTGSLPSVLALHDFMGRVIFAKLKGTDSQVATFNLVGNQVRPAYMFGTAPKESDSPEQKKKLADEAERLRGRTTRPNAPGPTKAPGLLPGGDPSRDTYQERERGVDRWMPTSANIPQSTLDIQQRNLIFGAGPSGSTGTLLQAAQLFGNLDTQLLQQYVLAIVGYLVGGGMHSYHEVMVIARMAGCPYKDGAYVPSLPESFLRTKEFTDWRDQYWDIVVLGGKLWNLDDPAPVVRRLDAERVSAFADIFKPRQLV